LILTGYSSLNLVEWFFSIITCQAIRRGSFTSVRQFPGHLRVHRKLERLSQPLVCTEDADEIFASIQRAEIKTTALTEH
jgi:hypothetical protein